MLPPPKSQDNIWIAAGNGDLERVKDLLDNQGSDLWWRKHTSIHCMLGTDPNGPDEFSYTPMHAAASYGQIQVLEYLISRGGNVNVTDDDGDTPLYTVEDTNTALFLLQHGANLDIVNNAGVSVRHFHLVADDALILWDGQPITSLSEDFPNVSAFLQAHSSNSPPPPDQNSDTSNSSLTIPGRLGPSQHAQDQASESLTSSLLSSIQEQFSDRPEAPSEEELQRVVSQAVLRSMREGYSMGTADMGGSAGTVGETRDMPDDANGFTHKKPRLDED